MSISISHFGGGMTVPTGRVPFRAELPEELGALQHRLAILVGEVDRACRDGDHERLGEPLHALDETLHQYLIDEGLQFEPYLRAALEQDLETLQLMQRLRTRLRELAREVHDVAALGARVGAGARTLRIVGETIARVGPQLAQCLEWQRTLLFPRYRPAAAAVAG